MTVAELKTRMADLSFIILIYSTLNHDKQWYTQNQDSTKKNSMEYVSVSSILGRTSTLFDPNKQKGLEIWRQMQPDWEEIIASAQRRGTIVHSEIELSFFGDDEKSRAEKVTMKEIMQYNINEYMTHLDPVLDIIKQENFHEKSLSHLSWQKRFYFAIKDMLELLT